MPGQFSYSYFPLGEKKILKRDNNVFSVPENPEEKEN